jgi:DNA-directed RNA polymerase subunit RPC12/RpoP
MKIPQPPCAACGAKRSPREASRPKTTLCQPCASSAVYLGRVAAKKRIGWGRVERAPGDTEYVRCATCGRRTAIDLTDALRGAKWPECHGQVMDLLSPEEVEQHRASEASDGEEDAEESTDG